MVPGGLNTRVVAEMWPRRWPLCKPADHAMRPIDCRWAMTNATLARVGAIFKWSHKNNRQKRKQDGAIFNQSHTTAPRRKNNRREGKSASWLRTNVAYAARITHGKTSPRTAALVTTCIITVMIMIMAFIIIIIIIGVWCISSRSAERHFW